ncbi:MAG: hypothetical protein PHG61_00305 [Candidatus Marinimicrobia bacterium]|nr:hypothetical protein [Candidatus Neomarinimicrobiota bacterium]
MSLTSKVKQVWAANDNVAFRPSQVYLVATGAYTIFQVVDGAIYVKALIGRITADAVGATTIATTLNTVAGEAAAVPCNGAVGTLVWVPLNVAATLVNVVAQPLTDALFAPKGMVVGTQAAGPGLIVATYAVGTSLTMEWSLLYQKLNPQARVI